MAKQWTPAPIFHMPKNNCPHCGANLDAASGTIPDTARPAPGDISVCGYCACVSQFDDDLMLIALTDEEYADLPSDLLQHMARMQQLIDLEIARKPHA